MIDQESNKRIDNSGGDVTNEVETVSRNGDEADDGESACAAFQALMAERIAAGEDLMEYPHMKTCARCSALMGELESIVDFAKTLLNTEAEPPETLWKKIESALESGSDVPHHLSLGASEA